MTSAPDTSKANALLATSLSAEPQHVELNTGHRDDRYLFGKLARATVLLSAVCRLNHQTFLVRMCMDVTSNADLRRGMHMRRASQAAAHGAKRPFVKIVSRVAQ